MNNINLKILRRHIQAIFFFAHNKCQREALYVISGTSLSSDQERAEEKGLGPDAGVTTCL